MRQHLFFAFFLAAPLFVGAQTQTPDFGSCFGKANRKSIEIKMDNLMARVGEEAGCPKDKLTYTVEEYYTVFYTKQCKHLPKRISFDVCGEKRTYLHKGLSGNIAYWLLGSWALVEHK